MPSYLPMLAAIVGVTEELALPCASLALGENGPTWAIQGGAGTVEAIVVAATTCTVTDISSGKEAEYDGDDVDDVYDALLVLGLVLVIIRSLEYLNGFGQPDPGQAFIDGHATFATHIADTIAAAQATHWLSPGAQAYNLGNVVQLTRVRTVANADRKIAEILANQAAQVELARQLLAGLRLAATGALLVAFALAQHFWNAEVSGNFTLATGIAYALVTYKYAMAAAVAGGALVVIATLTIEGIQTHDDLTTARGGCPLTHRAASS